MKTLEEKKKIVDKYCKAHNGVDDMTILQLMYSIAYTKDGAFVGFDTDVAKAVCQKLGVTAVFQEIDWDEKELELNGYTIDAIWNGMTYTEERAEAMSMSNSYLRNKQVAVVRKGEASRVN